MIDEPLDPTQRQPRGDHNRRLSFGMDADTFAELAGISVEQLKDYENTQPDQEFDPDVAARVGAALQFLDENPPDSEIVIN